MSGAVRGKRRSDPKADLKPSRLPVTKCKPEVSNVIRIDRGLPAKVRLLDRGNNFVRWLKAAEARLLISRCEVETLGTRRKIRAVRWISPAPETDHGKAYVIRRRGYGDSHCRETPINPRGVWTIDEVRDKHRPLFTRVLDDCLAA